ncbi:hypothetical protein UFOVP84_216 [uncultured Caudovirales phage]|uniref:Uncharacterized protein n=1 Tax=uncultured Caudovirales phage TaxID=2100421 RepID=A0A6J5L2H0_9CAUD|nr:hypothetical protein UFOVP84_216 [uncultured Caudovirales phage]
MNNLAISFASLVKNHKGLFKSEKQAEFLLKMCQEHMTFIAPGNVGRYGYCMYYICDEKGVVRVEKSLQSKGGVTVTWERGGEGKVTVQDTKEIKRLKRELKQFQKALEDGLNYAWADPIMGEEVARTRKENIEKIIKRLLELGVI